MNDVEYTRLRWQCRRGMLELDIILLGFFDHYFKELDVSDQDAFVRLLDRPDTSLYAWFLGYEAPPAELLPIIQRIQATQPRSQQ
jgi:antitoxin CptB